MGHPGLGHSSQCEKRAQTRSCSQAQNCLSKPVVQFYCDGDFCFANLIRKRFQIMRMRAESAIFGSAMTG